MLMTYSPNTTQWSRMPEPANNFPPQTQTSAIQPAPLPSSQNEAVSALAGRADTLWKRLLDIEHTLAVQEWWLLGRALAEARLLAEISSLLAVARGELENVLILSLGRNIARSDATDQFPAVGDEVSDHMSDPAWIAANRDQAIGLLRMVALALPPMLQYAQMLRAYAERLGFAPGVVDALSIVGDRLSEVSDMLHEPPR